MCCYRLLTTPDSQHQAEQGGHRSKAGLAVRRNGRKAARPCRAPAACQSQLCPTQVKAQPPEYPAGKGPRRGRDGTGLHSPPASKPGCQQRALKLLPRSERGSAPRNSAGFMQHFEPKTSWLYQVERNQVYRRRWDDPWATSPFVLLPPEPTSSQPQHKPQLHM